MEWRGTGGFGEWQRWVWAAAEVGGERGNGGRGKGQRWVWGGGAKVGLGRDSGAAEEGSRWGLRDGCHVMWQRWVREGGRPGRAGGAGQHHHTLLLSLRTSPGTPCTSPPLPLPITHQLSALHDRCRNLAHLHRQAGRIHGAGRINGAGRIHGAARSGT